MSETKFTPGPWTLRGADTYRWQIETTDAPRKATVVARITTPTRGGAEASDANARLIASAPDLYATLEALMVGGWIKGESGLVSEARAALAKARGE